MHPLKVLRASLAYFGLRDGPFPISPLREGGCPCLCNAHLPKWVCFKKESVPQKPASVSPLAFT